MMQQLERLMGAVPFRDGVRKYLKTYAYGNASWPDLIHILDKYTSADLEAWNKVWVNEAGRPRISYQCETNGNIITRLTLTQKGEDGSARVWPQFFELALVYPDHTESYTVNLKAASVAVPEVSGKPRPLYILFNSGGEGYGVFPIDTQGIAQIDALPGPLMRASAYINQYENMLDGSGDGRDTGGVVGSALTPRDLLEQDRQYLLTEKAELNLGVLLGQISSIFWHFTKPADRVALAPGLESILWTTMEKTDQPNEKKLLFSTYASIALTRNAQDSVYKAWNRREPPPGVKLSEDDYTGLAAGLAIRTYPGYRKILQTQASRIQNPDRRARFQYIQPSLSEDQAVRDSFFVSLKDPKNRQKEAWVLSALGYLHHPLRTGVSEKYLPASLDWLLDIQRTGDVFFPERWLQASFGNYQTASAAAVVRHFLETHPGYNPKLREKILQTTDNLFRAETLLAQCFKTASENPVKNLGTE
jgi:aminopeptidase N